MQVELRHLRAFVAVAEELNFTRAAARMHIAQQALSKQIAQLEERVGTALLERTTRKVELTPAGAALLEQARPLLSGADQAVLAARQAAATARPTLTVGFVAAVTYERAGAAIEEFRRARPDVDVLVNFGELVDPSGGLRSEAADVAFTHGPFDTTGLELLPLWSEPMGVVLSEDHPLLESGLTTAAIVAEPTFDFPTTDREWKDFWMLTKHRNGRPPKIVAEFRSIDAMLNSVRLGLGIHQSAESIGAMLPPGSGLTFRVVHELDPLDHQLAWRAGDTRQVVRDFADAARTAFLGTE